MKALAKFVAKNKKKISKLAKDSDVVGKAKDAGKMALGAASLGVKKAAETAAKNPKSAAAAAAGAAGFAAGRESKDDLPEWLEKKNKKKKKREYMDDED